MVTGFALATVGLVVAGVVVARQVRAVRRRWVRTSPLSVLTVAQRRDLLAQVRGQEPVDQARVGLARRMAEELLQQGPTVWTNGGLTTLWTGLAVALPSWWRVGVAVASAVLSVVIAVTTRRDVRSARIFPAAHPADDA